MRFPIPSFIAYTILFLSVSIGSSRADLVLQFGNTPLLANTANQQILVYGLFQPGPSAVTQVGGMQLNVRINDGTGIPGSAPVFQGVSFSGTIWEGSSFDTIGNVPEPGFPQYASIGLSFQNNVNSRTLNSVPQILARLFVDTTGVFTGTPTITFNDVDLGPSYFLSAGDVPLLSDTLVTSTGSFSITAVPEPSSVISGGILGIGMFVFLLRTKMREKKKG